MTSKSASPLLGLSTGQMIFLPRGMWMAEICSLHPYLVHYFDSSQPASLAGRPVLETLAGRPVWDNLTGRPVWDNLTGRPVSENLAGRRVLKKKGNVIKKEEFL